MKRVTRSKVRKFYKVQWEHHTESESTWALTPLGAFPFQYRAAGRGSRGACLRTVAEDIGSGKFWKRKCPSDVPVC